MLQSHYRFLSIAVFSIILSSATFHAAIADEFGDRFYNQTPPGLADGTGEAEEIPDIAMDDAAQDMQNIMPAAGESNEQQSTTEKTVE